MQDVEQLSLVLVDAFDLAIEERIRVDDLTGRRLEPVGEAHFGGSLGLAEVGDKGGIIGQWHEMMELGQVRDPAVADGLNEQAGKVGVRQQEPAARRDAVGLVVEPLRKHVGEILHYGGAQ